jgi:tetratricopeptide (TPR) repeat protein
MSPAVIEPETCASQARAVGVEPIDAVHLMENHDRAYHIWREAGVRDRALVHIDAHHDMWWIDDLGTLSIANFVCPALKEGMVGAVYWVVPDATWDGRARRAALRGHLRRIQERYPGAPARVHWEGRLARTAVMGRPFVICALDSLPPAELVRPVLLDIDTDYLTIPAVAPRDEWDAHSPLPWRWPAELFELLREKHISTDLVTIAYSSEGGYTPLLWKYLGAELAARLRQPRGEGALEAYERMREGAVAAHRGDGEGAEAAFRAVGDRLGAAPHAFLAHLLADRELVDEARQCYQRALGLDPSYRAAFSSPGVPLYFERSYAAAERAFHRTLLLDPADACGHLGLGWIAARRRRWGMAERCARASLRHEPQLIDAHRLLARALAKQGRLEEAISAYEGSLKLALAGHRPFDGVIVTSPDRARMLDAEHGRTHALLARLHERRGDHSRAAVGYRMAIATGHDVAEVRLHLARACARIRRWADARRHVAAGLRLAPGAVRARAVRAWREARASWRVTVSSVMGAGRAGGTEMNPAPMSRPSRGSARHDTRRGD